MVGLGSTPLGHVLPRRAASSVADALGDTRVVLVTGARQCGKSTLVRVLATGRRAEWRNLDAAAARQAARADPSGFVDSEDLMVIDEIQRAPELLLSIKEQVDADPRPGRYLLTGSARVLGLRALPDTLPGRTETIELWPFSQGEIDGTGDGFVDAAFDDGPLSHASTRTRREYAERVVRGGFPESVARTNPRRRERFLDSYVADLVARDVSQLSEIERPAQMRALLRLLAARSAQPLVGNALSNDLRLSARTVHRYLGLLDEVFLIKRIPAWSRNISSRAVGTPKLAFVDSGVAANLLGVDARSLTRPGAPFGQLLEAFVLMELARQLTWARRRVELFHYRTKDGTEVDAVLEDRRGRVVGIEVKASSTVRAEDFRGLRHLADRLGDDFVAGYVLYTGGQTLPFGPRLRAVPVAALWELPTPDG
ncbi:ATP-binding protein [Pseudonocardia acaciae]|uniref:ATP-binding protein n=1 Tax=Pseudonocardia acaciae TaxID=551276 RepID=UPI00048BD43E|nr:ATP-binding protein [Pseudonocardia acaciae]